MSETPSSPAEFEKLPYSISVITRDRVDFIEKQKQLFEAGLDWYRSPDEQEFRVFLPYSFEERGINVIGVNLINKYLCYTQEHLCMGTIVGSIDHLITMFVKLEVTK